LAEEVAQLEDSGATVVALTPEEESRSAQVFGILNPASRKPAAEAGEAQAHGKLPYWLISGLAPEKTIRQLMGRIPRYRNFGRGARFKLR
jgi:hypothetical protein